MHKLRVANFLCDMHATGGLAIYRVLNIPHALLE